MGKLLFRHQIEDMVLLFTELNNIVSLILVPYGQEKDVNYSNDIMDGIVQLHLLGDVNFSHYSSGRTMRNSSTATSFCVKNQKIDENSREVLIQTIFTNPIGLEVNNVIIFDKGRKSLKTCNVLTNGSDSDIVVDMFASFCVSGISPYKNIGTNIFIHRMYGNWSAEGRPECVKAEDLGMEQSWADYGLRLEKFGAIGSMPVQRYFPFLAIEDRDNNTFWGVLEEAPYSWQIEISRYNRFISMSGGTADYEYGHFKKTVKQGEKYITKGAFLTVCNGKIDDVWNRLRKSIETNPFTSQEENLPIIYNEYCDSWGGPSHDRIIKAAKKAKELGAKYFVIDAGWYCDSPNKWSIKVGDYVVNKKAFPYSIAETARMIREIGLIPGIWFEMECVAKQADLFADESLFIKKDGYRILSGNRGFLDFRNERVHDLLKKNIIDFLKENGFGYIKIDYNECIGIGCDGDESYGSGLGLHIEKVMDFIGEIRREIPNIVIESCASGGHRIEPSFLSISDMTSFSDAHEGYEGAVVAANVNKLCPTSKNQIWAVVNNDYSLNRVRYSLAKTLFGRMCLSGDIVNMTEDRLEIIKSFVKIYNKSKNVLRGENNYYFGNTDLKYLGLKGGQAVLKISSNQKNALIIAHGFNDSTAISIEYKGLEKYEIDEVFSSSVAKIDRKGDSIIVNPGDLDACVIYLVKS